MIMLMWIAVWVMTKKEETLEELCARVSKKLENINRLQNADNYLENTRIRKRL